MGWSVSGNPKRSHGQPIFNLWAKPGEKQRVEWQTARCLWKKANLRTMRIKRNKSELLSLPVTNPNWTCSSTFHPPFPILISVFQPLNHSPSQSQPQLAFRTSLLRRVMGWPGTTKYEKRMRKWGPLAYKRNNKWSHDSYRWIFESLTVKDKTSRWINMQYVTWISWIITKMSGLEFTGKLKSV